MSNHCKIQDMSELQDCVRLLLEAKDKCKGVFFCQLHLRVLKSVITRRNGQEWFSTRMPYFIQMPLMQQKISKNGAKVCNMGEFSWKF